MKLILFTLLLLSFNSYSDDGLTNLYRCFSEECFNENIENEVPVIWHEGLITEEELHESERIARKMLETIEEAAEEYQEELSNGEEKKLAHARMMRNVNEKLASIAAMSPCAMQCFKGIGGGAIAGGFGAAKVMMTSAGSGTPVAALVFLGGVTLGAWQGCVGGACRGSNAKESTEKKKTNEECGVNPDFIVPRLTLSVEAGRKLGRAEEITNWGDVVPGGGLR